MSAPILRVISPANVPERRGCAVDPETLARAAEILRSITERGDEAVIAHARRLGDLTDSGRLTYTPDDLVCALDGIPIQDREVLERAANRIRAFANAQRACLRDLTLDLPAGQAGHTCMPVASAGCYAPGGRFPLPSSVLMTAVTARAAGVKSVWVASPRPTRHTLAAAAIAGADGLLAIGGVQAIAAMARGLVGVPRCDVIVGPGNRWVTAAKQLLSGEIGIDMLAGPSELVVLADDSADAAVVAADLIAQAEHDDDAVPILVCTDAELARRVDDELRRQLLTLPTADTARAALANGFAVIAPTTAEAIEICDRLAPEHLEVQTRDAERVAAAIRNAGAVFIGPRSAEVLGDYAAGPNHVLPTGGTSRFRAGLSVFTFLRCRTWLRIDDSASARTLIHDSASLARIEGLEGHARSALARDLPAAASAT